MMGGPCPPSPAAGIETPIKLAAPLVDTMRSLKTYLELLDAVVGPSSPTIQPSR